VEKLTITLRAETFACLLEQIQRKELSQIPIHSFINLWRKSLKQIRTPLYYWEHTVSIL